MCVHCTATEQKLPAYSAIKKKKKQLGPKVERVDYNTHIFTPSTTNNNNIVPGPYSRNIG